MAMVAVIIVPFYAAIIATRQEIGTSSPGDVVLMVLVRPRQISFGEIVDVTTFDMVGEAILHGALIDGQVEQSACFWPT